MMSFPRPSTGCHSQACGRCVNPSIHQHRRSTDKSCWTLPLLGVVWKTIPSILEALLHGTFNGRKTFISPITQTDACATTWLLIWCQYNASVGTWSRTTNSLDRYFLLAFVRFLYFPCFISFACCRSDLFIQMDVLVPSVNGTSGVLLGARMSKGGCDVGSTEGVFFFIFLSSDPGSFLYMVTNDTGLLDILIK